MAKRQARLEVGREVGECHALLQVPQTKKALKTRRPGLAVLFPNFCLKIPLLWPYKGPLISPYPNSFYQCFLRKNWSFTIASAPYLPTDRGAAHADAMICGSHGQVGGVFTPDRVPCVVDNRETSGESLWKLTDRRPEPFGGI